MRRIFLPALSLILLLAVSCTTLEKKPGLDTLEKRVEEYKEAVNYGKDNPSGIYEFLTEEYKALITEEEFIEAYEKDRTYPYITPLYIWQPEIEMSEDGLTATVTYQRAARIVGMTWTAEFVYENGNY